jgi:hypothetical protein
MVLISVGQGAADGHIRPRNPSENSNQKWQEVVGLIAEGADVEHIAAASADAAEHGIERASDDPGLAHAFWLLTQIPQAARQANFADRLWELGLSVPSNKPTLLEIVAAFTRAVDHHVLETGRRSDLGEMAQHAAAETLTYLTGRELPAFLDRLGLTLSRCLQVSAPQINSVLLRGTSFHD